MKRQRWSIGAIVKIPLENSQNGYAQLLEKYSIAVFDLLTYEELDMAVISQSKVLFIVAIYADIIPSGRWEKIGKTKVVQQLEKLPMKFIQDILNLDQFELYDPNTGLITKASRQECEGLERAAVWEAEHIESRISDYFEGKENVWVNDLKIK